MLPDRKVAVGVTDTKGSSGLRAFFFQAEDGIRDHCVTGVQTCALPISLTKRSRTFPETRNPRSLCTRAATMPVNERSDGTERSTASIRTRGGCVRGSLEEEAASLHAAKTKGDRPMTAATTAGWR